jgi:integrase
MRDGPIFTASCKKHVENMLKSPATQFENESTIRVAARPGAKTKTKPATVQRELAMLHRAFELGFQAGKVYRVPPFPTIAVNNAREVYFERDEFDRLLAELPDDFIRPLATLACWVGFRRHELLRLEWRQVDFDRKTVRLGVGTTKNKEGRVVVLPDEALATLKSWRERTTALEHEHGCIIARVFHRDGEPVDFFPYKAWRSACKRAKIPGRRPHDFRRTMARNYRRSGEAEGVIMKIGGWKTRSVFERYNIVAEDDLRRAAERVTFSANGARMGQVVAINSTKKDASA